MYDLVHQILTGRIDGGLNRDLIIALFRDARLLHRILEGHEKNDVRRLADICVYAYFDPDAIIFSKVANPRG